MSKSEIPPEEIRTQMDAFQNDRELYSYALRKVSKNTLGRGQWPVSNPSCKTCKFWVADKYDEQEGHCHRYAPRPGSPLHQTGGGMEWPKVYCDTWCGEYEEKCDA